MPQIHAARRARAQQKIAELGADAALITSLPNVRYLTGMVSSNAALLLPAAGPGVLAVGAVAVPRALAVEDLSVLGTVRLLSWWRWGVSSGSAAARP
jgi:Xaa-Pro aminopeptidase